MKLDPKHAMVVLSGGQDSTTCLGYALDRFETVSCVTFDYNQRHRRELEAANQVVGFFERKTGRMIAHEIVKIGDIFAGTSPLTNSGEQLETYANAAEMDAIIGDRVEKTFVPMRNAVFLMLAANRAVVAGAGVLVTGVCEADNANYPDCRLTFIASAERAVNFALGTEREDNVGEGMQIATPLINMSKAQSIHLAITLPHTYAALALSHTAYDGEYPPNGRDHASVLRAHGFEVAGVPDPLVVRAYQERKMELPDTENYRPVRGTGRKGGFGFALWSAQDFADLLNARRRVD